MNRKLWLFCALTLPIFLFWVVAQSVQYHEIEKSLLAKQKEQVMLVDKNKKTLIGVTVLQAVPRIKSISEEDLGLKPVGAEKSIKIQFGKNEQGK